MFVGAGRFQLPGILKAKEMGLKIVAIDKNPHAPGLRIADVPICMDIKNIKGCLKIAKKYKIDGVTTIASEIALPTVATIAEELGLVGIKKQVAKISNNKELQRKCFKKANVPSPAFHPVFSLKEAKRTIRDFGFPVVVKPVDNAGARGVSKVENWKQLEFAFKWAKKHSRCGKILVEKFMEGCPISVEEFVYKRKKIILVTSDKEKTPPPYLVDTLVCFPSKFENSERWIRKIETVAKKATKAVGIDNSPAHIEMMMTEKGPMLIELGARGAGFKVFTDIIPNITGVDVLEATINLAVGEKPNLKKTKKKGSVLLFFKNTPGRLRKVVGVASAKKISGIYEIDIYVKPGDIIRPLRCGDDRIGHIISLGNNREHALKIAKMAEKKIKFITQN